MGVRTYQLSSALPLSLKARWAGRLLLWLFLMLTDLAMVLFGMGLAYYLRFEVGLSWFYRPEVLPYTVYHNLIFLLVPFWLIVLALFGMYNIKRLFTGFHEYMRAFNACTFGMMVIVLYIFFAQESIARGWVLLTWVLLSASLIVGRFTFRRVIQQIRARGHFQTTVLVVGANEEARAITEQLYTNPKAGVQIAGIVANNLEQGSELLPGVPVLGSIDAIERMVRQHHIQEIIIASTAISREQLLNLFQAFGTNNNINIRLSSGLYELLTTGVEVHEIGNVPLMSINKMRLTGVDVVLKSMLDLLVSVIVLLFIWPVMLAIAIAIKLDSPGPVFYQRKVVGAGGKPFRAWKFRTMYTDADERLSRDPELRRAFEKNHKLKDDPRVTRVGKFLRRTSLDELPQIFNVLGGQMSLVGPRMITEAERIRYGKWRMNLSTVKPGITGLWQVSGRSDISYEERVMLDMHYIRNHTIWLDLYLLWLTVPAVLKQRGAY